MRQRGWIEKETNRNKATVSLDDGEIFFYYNKECMVTWFQSLDHVYVMDNIQGTKTDNL